MKYYIGFYVILILLCICIFIVSLQIRNVELNLLKKAYSLTHSSNIEYDYLEFKKEYENSKKILMMIINHIQYKEVSVCIIKIENDIKFNDNKSFNSDLKELIFLLEEIIDGEKCNLSNIF